MIWHRAIPGPLYWEWRCLRCSHWVALHARGPRLWLRLHVVHHRARAAAL